MTLNTLAFPMPEEVQTIFNEFNKASYEINLVGGCIRDYFMGKTIKDYDFCTNATPDEVKELFKGKYEVIDTGIKHGTVTVIINNKPFEITTYRIDKYEKEGEINHRTPSETILSSKDCKVSLLEDLSRRDFTINAMAFDGEKFIDPFEGRVDRAKKYLRCVGDANERFNEDALRILRGIRFSVTHNLKIEGYTLRAMFKQKGLLHFISKERITKELIEILNCPIDIKSNHWILAEILSDLFPEYFEMSYLRAGKKEVFERLAKVFKTKTPAYFKMAFLMRCCLDDGVCITTLLTDFREEKEKNKIFMGAIQNFCQNCLRCTNDFTKKVMKIHEVGNFLYDNLDLIKTPFYGRLYYPGGLVLHRLGKSASELNFWTILYVSNLTNDRLALKKTNTLLKTLEKMIKDTECYPYMYGHIKIKGDDLELIGIKGKEIKSCFDYLLNQLMMREIPNDRETLMYKALQFKKRNVIELPSDSKLNI